MCLRTWDFQNRRLLPVQRKIDTSPRHASGPALSSTHTIGRSDPAFGITQWVLHHTKLSILALQNVLDVTLTLLFGCITRSRDVCLHRPADGSEVVFVHNVQKMQKCLRSQTTFWQEPHTTQIQQSRRLLLGMLSINLFTRFRTCKSRTCMCFAHNFSDKHFPLHFHPSRQIADGRQQCTVSRM